MTAPSRLKFAQKVDLGLEFQKTNLKKTPAFSRFKFGISEN